MATMFLSNKRRLLVTTLFVLIASIDIQTTLCLESDHSDERVVEKNLNDKSRRVEEGNIPVSRYTITRPTENTGGFSPSTAPDLDEGNGSTEINRGSTSFSVDTPVPTSANRNPQNNPGLNPGAIRPGSGATFDQPTPAPVRQQNSTYVNAPYVPRPAPFPVSGASGSGTLRPPTLRPTVQTNRTNPREPVIPVVSVPIDRPGSYLIDSSDFPSDGPSLLPSNEPSSEPSHSPTSNPTTKPSKRPTPLPTRWPTREPSPMPTTPPLPTDTPTPIPTIFVTTEPSEAPSKNPTARPSGYPTTAPSSTPTISPSSSPSSFLDTLRRPSTSGGANLNTFTARPTITPSSLPSDFPSLEPSFFGQSSVPTATAGPTERQTEGNEEDSEPNYPVYPTWSPTTWLPTVSNHPTYIYPWLKPANLNMPELSTDRQEGRFFRPSGGTFFNREDDPDQPDGGISRPGSNNFGSTVTSSPIDPNRNPANNPASQNYVARPGAGATFDDPTPAPIRRVTSSPIGGSSQNSSGFNPIGGVQRPGGDSSSNGNLSDGILQEPTLRPTFRRTGAPIPLPGVSVAIDRPGSFLVEKSDSPSDGPSFAPSDISTPKPSFRPTPIPTLKPSKRPTAPPTTPPTRMPTLKPSFKPTPTPTAYVPSRTPSNNPTASPTSSPSAAPSTTPSEVPTASPSSLFDKVRRPSQTTNNNFANDASGTESSSPGNVPTVQPTTPYPVWPTWSPTTWLPTVSNFPTYLYPWEKPDYVAPQVNDEEGRVDRPDGNSLNDIAGGPNGASGSIDIDRGSASFVDATPVPTSPNRNPANNPANNQSNVARPVASSFDRPTPAPIRRLTASPNGAGSTQNRPFPVSSYQRPSTVGSGTSTSSIGGGAGNGTGGALRAPTFRPTFRRYPTNPPVVVPVVSVPVDRPGTYLVDSSTSPSDGPSAIPSNHPTPKPSFHPTPVPSPKPSRRPTVPPTKLPTRRPTLRPTLRPTPTPTVYVPPNPTAVPTTRPTDDPSSYPTRVPTASPSTKPTMAPTTYIGSLRRPGAPSSSTAQIVGTRSPTHVPSNMPSDFPSLMPSLVAQKNTMSPIETNPVTSNVTIVSNDSTDEEIEGVMQTPTFHPAAHPTTARPTSSEVVSTQDNDEETQSIMAIEPTTSPTWYPTTWNPTTWLPTTERRWGRKDNED